MGQKRRIWVGWGTRPWTVGWVISASLMLVLLVQTSTPHDNGEGDTNG